RDDREKDEWDVEKRRERVHHLEEQGRGAGVCLRERALPEVVDHEGEEDPDPCPPYPRASEVTHVGVERLPARGAEDHRSEDQERCGTVRDEEAGADERVDREKDRGCTGDHYHAREGERGEP